MKNLCVQICAGVLLAVTKNAALAQAQPAPQATAGNAIPVTVDNFIRAESDRYLGDTVKNGGLGKFIHKREPMRIEEQFVIRPNRDTLYSFSTFDLDAGPVTITLPDAGKRYLTMQAFSEDHYVVGVFYGAGSHTLTKEQVGTRYAVVGIRALVDPADPKDVQQVHALQDALKVELPSGPGRFEVPNWDQASQKKVRDALLVLGSTLPDLRHAFGARSEVDPVRHLIGTASAWGGNPDKEAIYLNITPSKNDGKTVYKLNVKEVPVDAFWSISLYNAQGYFVKNQFDSYSINNITAKKSADGTITIQFGGCDGQIPNCLPTMPGWNYMVRLYRPRAEIPDGTWKFPEAQPAS